MWTILSVEGATHHQEQSHNPEPLNCSSSFSLRVSLSDGDCGKLRCCHWQEFQSQDSNFAFIIFFLWTECVCVFDELTGSETALWQMLSRWKVSFQSKPWGSWKWGGGESSRWTWFKATACYFLWVWLGLNTVRGGSNSGAWRQIEVLETFQRLAAVIYI